MLTAWMRFKYPNMVDGGLAASAPIYYIDDGLIPRTAFFAKVTEVCGRNAIYSHWWERRSERGVFIERA